MNDRLPSNTKPPLPTQTGILSYPEANGGLSSNSKLPPLTQAGVTNLASQTTSEVPNPDHKPLSSAQIGGLPVANNKLWDETQPLPNTTPSNPDTWSHIPPQTGAGVISQAGEDGQVAADRHPTLPELIGDIFFIVRMSALSYIPYPQICIIITLSNVI